MTDEEMKRFLEATRQHFDETADRLTSENRHFFEISTEATRHEIGLIAEKVTWLDEKFDRHAAESEDRMQRGFADTQAMIKFSHAELDRRVRALEQTQRTLEESMTDLLARVERLEGSTH
ncbi:MAG TPA: hypothetical protein VFV49_17415 [Thermoanaerobaculia bacterium]|nr:hypothetical protein [Thermoanaerobaculia bacterium]